MMKETKSEDQYKEWSKTYDEERKKIFEKYGAIDYKEFMNSLIKFCDLKPHMNILDLGAGTGLTSIALAKDLSGNCQILAIEPVENMIKQMEINIKKEGFENIISIERAIGESIPSSDNNFDLIICSFAIRHMTIKKVLGEFKRVLKPEGRIVIADICAPAIWRTWWGKFFSYFFLRILSLKKKYRSEKKSTIYSVKEWKHLLEEMGFAIIQIEEFLGKKDPQWEVKRVIISMHK